MTDSYVLSNNNGAENNLGYTASVHPFQHSEDSHLTVGDTEAGEVVVGARVAV